MTGFALFCFILSVHADKLRAGGGKYPMLTEKGDEMSVGGTGGEVRGGICPGLKCPTPNRVGK